MRSTPRFGGLVALTALVVMSSLSSCVNGPDTTRTEITTFEVNPSSALRGDEVTLTWVATDVGEYPGIPACTLTRRAEGEQPDGAFAVACSGSLTEVPPAPASSSYVRYQLSVLKDPYVPTDPYLIAVVTVQIAAVPAVVSVSIDQDDLEMFVGDERALTATVLVEGGATPDVSWASSDTDVVIIASDTGTVTATGEGVAEITATSSFDGSSSDSILLSVAYGPFGDQVLLVGERGARGRYSVAVDGKYALVSRDDGLRGNVEVYERDVDGTWALDGWLDAPWDGDFGTFAWSVDLSGTTAVVSDSQLVATDASVYESLLRVYRRAPTGDWVERAVLLEGAGVSYMDFALGAGVLVVGLPSRGLGGESSVRVYEQDEGGANAWGLAATIPVPPLLAGDSADAFATDVDISQDGNQIAVVSSTTDWDSCRGEAVLIYERSQTDASGWEIADVIEDSEIRAGSTCTAYVAMDRDVLALTSRPAGTAGIQVFERGADGSGAWSEVAYSEFAVPRNVDDGLFLGQVSMSVRGTTAVLGFAGEDCSMGPAPCAPGEVRVLNRDVGGTGAWGVAHVLTPAAGYADQGFGASVDVSGDGRSVIVGTNPGASVDPSQAGEAYIVER